MALIPKLKQRDAARVTKPQIVTARGEVKTVQGLRVPVDRKPEQIDFAALVAKQLGVESLAEITVPDTPDSPPDSPPDAADPITPDASS